MKSRQWVCWKRDPERGKIPKNPKTGGNAQSNNPSTWASYELAEKVSPKYDGIGFMFADGVCGIDIDGAENNPERAANAQAIIQLIDTYTEYSPSGTGYHLIFRCDVAKLPKDYKAIYYQKNPSNGLECYFSGLTNRFFTYTGEAVNNRDIEDRTEQVIMFLEKYMKRTLVQSAELPPNELPSDILQVIRRAKNAPKFEMLFDHGDISAYNNDDSTADIALCNILAFYCRGDSNNIDSLFRQSALYREKWDRDDYRTNTINKAIALCGGNFYRGKGRPKKERPTVNIGGTDGQTEFITVQNVAAHLKEMGISLRYNVINRTADIQGLDPIHSPEHAADTLPILLYDSLKQIYLKCPKGDIQDALSVISSDNRYNPVLEMLSSAKWDKTDRLPEWFAILGIHSNDRLSMTLLYKWMWQGLSMARNELKDAYGADGALVLQGNQGIGKTSFVSKMAIQREFCSIGKSLNFHDKDTLRRCASSWLVELGEIETTFKSDKEKLKAFITDPTDLYRLPYGRTDVHLARRTSLVGTCNSTQYLIDETGNRRFWTVPIEHIELDGLAKFDALQLWAQVDELTRHNRQGFRLTRNEQAQLAERNGKHEKTLKSEDEIRDIMDMADRRAKDLSYKKVTVTEFKMAHDSLRNYTVQQIAQALTKIGIEAEPIKKVGGIPRRLRRLPVWTNSHYGKDESDENPFLQ